MSVESISPERRKHLGIAFAVGVVLAVATAGALVWVRGDYIAVFYIGALVGTGEIVSRYRDAPQNALWTVPAALYIAVNAAAAVAALYFVITFDVIHNTDPARTTITRVLLAGFGAMAFFRTSVFVVRVGDADVAVGPVAFLQVLLFATDRAVDRVRADDRATAVGRAMAGVSFDLAQAALPAFCLALMQNVTADDEKAVGDAVKDLLSSTLDAETRAKNLGLTLLNVVGERVLRTAVRELGAQIKPAATVTIDSPPPSIKIGSSVALRAVCCDAAGGVVEGKHVDWSSSDVTTAAVTADGHVRAMKAGPATISVKADQATDSIVVTVTA